MHKMNLLSLDLNLLKLLDALLQANSLTEAAKQVGLSQPAASHALERLRQTLKDPLFVRDGRGLAPTPRAIAMQVPLRQALSQIGELVAAEEFDPHKTGITFRLVAADYISRLLAPRLVARLAELAPGASLEIQPIDKDAAARLADGRADLILTVIQDDLADSLYRQPLFEDRLVCLMRGGHPATGGEFTMERYAAQSHITILITGEGTAPMDLRLAELGLKRRVALRLPHFLAAPAIAAESDLVFTIPKRIADTLRDDRLIVRELPIDPVRFTCSQVWHERLHRDPAHQWFRGLIREITDF